MSAGTTPNDKLALRLKMYLTCDSNFNFLIFVVSSHFFLFLFRLFNLHYLLENPYSPFNLSFTWSPSIWPFFERSLNVFFHRLKRWITSWRNGILESKLRESSFLRSPTFWRKIRGKMGGTSIFGPAMLMLMPFSHTLTYLQFYERFFHVSNEVFGNAFGWRCLYYEWG